MPTPEVNVTAADLFTLAKNKRPDLCAVARCNNPRRADNRLCPCHITRLWRARYPVKAAWHSLRTHARARKLAFDIPLDVFGTLCAATGYQFGVRKEHGHRACPTIDRIDPREGYVMGNIRVITLSENSVKGNFEKKILAGGWVIPLIEYDITAMRIEEMKRMAKHSPEIASALARIEAAATPPDEPDDHEPNFHLPGDPDEPEQPF